MYWEQLKELNDALFKRGTGVKRKTFAQMVKAVHDHHRNTGKHPRRRRPPKLCIEDQLLMTLMYLREYRTMFHISGDYAISEASVCRTIRNSESILVKHPAFRLPGKKSLLNSSSCFEIILIDAAESPIERPKKNNAGITPAKRKNTHSRHNL